MNHEPKYQRILDQLIREVTGGQYGAGEKFPSEAALVKRFGASRITVGHAVRELQQRGLVDRIAGSGTYVRAGSSPAGDSLRDSLLFGLVIPNLGETEIFEPICRAIARSPGASNHALLWPQGEDAVQMARQSVSRGVAGVFFAPLELSSDSEAVNQGVMKMLKDAGIPVVLLDRRPGGAGLSERCDLVGIDNHRAGVLATSHLLELGARRIGFVAVRHQAPTVTARIQGYRQALSDVECGPPRVLYLGEGGAAGSDAFDAFVCANDRVAGGLMHSLLARGVRIPQDVRIVGIDDVNYASLLPVPLTTIHQPCSDIGESALRAMLERLDHPRMAARDILLGCSLVIRQSCGTITS